MWSSPTSSVNAAYQKPTKHKQHTTQLALLCFKTREGFCFALIYNIFPCFLSVLSIRRWPFNGDGTCYFFQKKKAKEQSLSPNFYAVHQEAFLSESTSILGDFSVSVSAAFNFAACLYSSTISHTTLPFSSFTMNSP